MKIGEIDYNKKLPKKSLFLCKPNKQTIAKVSEAYDIQYHTKLSTVNELRFKIPLVIAKDNVPMENPNIERIKHRYLFKLKVGHTYEYFLFNEQNKSYSDDEYIEYTAYSLGVQLGDKSVREYELVGNLREVAEGALDDVYGKLEDIPIKRWTIGYVDSYFITNESAKRKYNVSSMSLLEVIYDIATKWNAVIKWNTEDLIIDFYKAENVGLNKGFYVRDGKYLESFNLSVDSSNTVTRMRAFGSEGLTFRGINPLGEDYIQDFSYYMFPFQFDKATNTVLKSSDYMSDELCIAITKFNDLVESLQDDFERLSTKINSLQVIVNQEAQRLSEITLERILIEDERDILLAEFQKKKEFWGTNGFNTQGTKEGTAEHAEIIARLRSKEQEESVQRAIALNAEMAVQDAEREIQVHLDRLSVSNNFTVDEWTELQQYIIVKEYTNDAITSPEDLLKETKIVFKQQQEPKIVLSVSIVDFLSIIECQNDWDKLGLGDSVKFKYDRLKVNIQAKIIEINYDFENSDIQLTIANEKDLKDGSEQLMDLLSKADITSTIVSMDRDGWNLSKENNGKINDLINSKWDSLKNAVLAGYDQQITISERGIIVKSLEDPNSWLVIQNGFLAITNDAGNTWKHAISKDGIWGEYIFGKVISGVNLYIEDESGAWKTQGSRTTIYNQYGDEVMWLGLVSDNARDQFDNIQRQEEECFGLVSWNDATKVELTDCKGFAISRWGNKYTDDGNYGWEKVLWANTDGTLYARDLVAQSLKIVNDIGETILDAENNYFNIGVLKNIVADGKLTTLEKLNLVTELHKIHADYKEVLNHAENYIRSVADDERNLEGAYNSSTGFTVSKSNIDRYSTQPLVTAYTNLMDYISQYIPFINKGISITDVFEIDINHPLMEETSEIADRGQFIEMFRLYHEESLKLKQEIENAIFYSGIRMGEYYNNVMIDEHGFVAVRSDGMYRAYLNATNGLALQKWERIEDTDTFAWVSKLYATLGDPNWEDGTLVAEGLVTKKLRIWDGEMDRITFDWYDGITIYGEDNGAVIYLNANDAIRISVHGDDKFWVGMDGRLYAKDITTHNLRIVDGNMGEKITFHHENGISIYGDNADIFLNANDAIRIKTKDGEDRFWVDTNGHLFAKNLYIQGDDDEIYTDIDGSYISDLTVNKLKTLNKNNRQNYIHIQDNYMKFKTMYDGEEKDKFTLTYEGTDSDAYPVMLWGAGGASTDSNYARQYKDGTGMYWEYKGTQNNRTKIGMTNILDERAFQISTDHGFSVNSEKDIYLTAKRKIIIQVGDNRIVINENGIEMKGTRIDLN